MEIEIIENGYFREPMVDYIKPDIVDDLEKLKTGFREMILSNKLKEIFLYEINAEY